MVQATHPVHAEQSTECAIWQRNHFMPRFVILRHELPIPHERQSHWDLMLEESGTLHTWQLPQPLDVQVDTAVRQLPNHRLAYLDYEGPIAGERGFVRREDQGTYVTMERDTTRWVVNLQGEKFRGQLQLTLVDPAGQGWSVRFVADEEATR